MGNSWIKYIFLFSIQLMVSDLCGQDLHFVQIQNAPQLLNPARTGVVEGYERASILHRSQWSTVGEPYNTSFASVDLPITKRPGNSAYLGAGFHYYSDKQGSLLKRDEMAFSISGILETSDKSILSLGLQAGFAGWLVTPDSYDWENQFTGKGFNSSIDPNESLGRRKDNFFDLGAGIYYEYIDDDGRISGRRMRKIGIGLGVFHLLSPDIEIHTGETLLPKFVLHSNMRFDLDYTPYSIMPQFLAMYQGGQMELMVGSLFRIEYKESTTYTGVNKEGAIAFGGHYRYGDALIPAMEWQHGNFILGMAYGFNTSKLNIATGGMGGWEIALRYTSFINALYKRRDY